MSGVCVCASTTTSQHKDRTRRLVWARVKRRLSPLRKPTEVKEKENGVSVNKYLYCASFLTGVNGSLGLACIQESIQEKLTLPEPFNAILEARSLYQHIY